MNQHKEAVAAAERAGERGIERRALIRFNSTQNKNKRRRKDLKKAPRVKCKEREMFWISKIVGGGRAKKDFNTHSFPLPTTSPST